MFNKKYSERKSVMKTTSKLIILSALSAAFAACSSTPVQDSKYMGQEVEAVSSADGNRPKWTYDSGWSIEDVRKQYGDDPKEPKYAYVVTNAAVKSDTAVPQCYAMAKTRASAEIGRQISETVKESKALTQDTEESEFMNEIRTKANNVVSGYEETDKFYMKLKGDEDKPFKCWVLMKFPRKNLKTLQGFVMKALEKEAGGNADMKARVTEATKEMMNEM